MSEINYDWSSISNIKINEVRRKLLDEHYSQLMSKGYVDCNSSLLRKIIYERLERDNIKFESTTIGFNDSVKHYASNELFNVKRIMKLIHNGCISEEFVLEAMNDNPGLVTMEVDEILKIFDNEESYDVRCSIINNLLYPKLNIFYHAGVRKPIKRIEI